MSEGPDANASWLRPRGNATCTDHDDDPLAAARLVLMMAASSSLSAVTVLGNLLVILSVKVNRRLRTVNNYFLLSLAAADLLVGAVSVNLYALYVARGSWPLGAAACDLWLVLDYVAGGASVLNLLIIGLDRFLCLTRPLSYPAWRSGRTACLMIAAAWLLSLALWAPAILCWQTAGGRRLVRDGECYTQLLASPGATLATTLPSFYLPALAMMGLYGRVSAASRRRLCPRCPGRDAPRDFLLKLGGEAASASCAPPRTRPAAGDTSEADASTPVPRAADESSSAGERRRRASATFSGTSSGTFSGASCSLELRRRRLAARERRVTRTILAVLLAFLVTWTPHNVMAVVAAFCHACVPGACWTAGYWLCYVNSAVNPGCYALCSATFRKTFCSLLRCR